MILLRILSIAYVATGIIATIAYWPTIKDLYYHQKPSANVASYFVWVITNGIALLYSLFILPDMLFRIVTALSFICCVVILLLAIRLKPL